MMNAVMDLDNRVISQTGSHRVSHAANSHEENNSPTKRARGRVIASGVLRYDGSNAKIIHIPPAYRKRSGASPGKELKTESLVKLAME